MNRLAFAIAFLSVFGFVSFGIFTLLVNSMKSKNKEVNQETKKETKKKK